MRGVGHTVHYMDIWHLHSCVTPNCDPKPYCRHLSLCAVLLFPSPEHNDSVHKCMMVVVPGLYIYHDLKEKRWKPTSSVYNKHAECGSKERRAFLFICLYLPLCPDQNHGCLESTVEQLCLKSVQDDGTISTIHTHSQTQSGTLGAVGVPPAVRAGLWEEWRNSVILRGGTQTVSHEDQLRTL